MKVTFVGFISNIHSVCDTYKWLAWVCKAPIIIVNIVQGFASTVLLVVLFMLVPIILRMLARFEGIPQKTGVELSLMNRFFMFQVIVSASCAAFGQISYKDVSERLSGRHVCVWHYRSFTQLSESSDGGPDTSGTETAPIFHVLSDVSGVPGLLPSLSYFRPQICNPPRSFRNGQRLPSNWTFGNVLCQNHPPGFDPTFCV